MASKFKLELDFEKLLERVKEAGEDVDAVAGKLADDCAEIAHSELVSECAASGVPSNVSSDITHSVNVTAGGNRYEIEVGWEKGAYDPKNPSNAYKAIFLNYGTVRRQTKKKVHHSFGNQWVTLGTDRGAVAARGFIGRAKKSTKQKCKKLQADALKKMTGG